MLTLQKLKMLFSHSELHSLPTFLQIKRYSFSRKILSKVQLSLLLIKLEWLFPFFQKNVLSFSDMKKYKKKYSKVDIIKQNTFLRKHKKVVCYSKSRALKRALSRKKVLYWKRKVDQFPEERAVTQFQWKLKNNKQQNALNNLFSFAFQCQKQRCF